jgi:hypothetical protein
MSGLVHRRDDKCIFYLYTEFRFQRRIASSDQAPDRLGDATGGNDDWAASQRALGRRARRTPV